MKKNSLMRLFTMLSCGWLLASSILPQALVLGEATQQRLPSADALARRAGDQPSASLKQQRVRNKFRALLEKHNIPLDLDLALKSSYQAHRSIKDLCTVRTEMRVQREMDAPLSGAELADTLLLPRNVELQDDTVIVANQLRFTGNEATIRGNHDIFILAGSIAFTDENDGSPVKGKLTIDTSAGRNKDADDNRGVNREPSRLPSPPRTNAKPASRFVGNQENVLRSMARTAGHHRGSSAGSLSTAGLSSSAQSGWPGQQGSNGVPGTDGDAGTAGAVGTCSSPPTSGGNGGNGKAGGNGGKGTAGANGAKAGDLLIVVAFDCANPDGFMPLVNFFFIAQGGDGGQGGNGGSGADGGKGGAGGRGGAGGDCDCAAGGGREGAPGGNGGNGGRGGNAGNGGDGGRGGDGGSVIVMAPYCLCDSVTVDAFNDGGYGGFPGFSGAYGLGSDGGAAGLGGVGGHSSPLGGCKNGRSGPNGIGGFHGPNGLSGSNGAFGSHGDGGVVFILCS